jgi:hypothetical protein
MKIFEELNFDLLKKEVVKYLDDINANMDSIDIEEDDNWEISYVENCIVLKDLCEVYVKRFGQYEVDIYEYIQYSQYRRLDICGVEVYIVV